MVAYKGPLSSQLAQLVGGLRTGMGLACCGSSPSCTSGALRPRHRRGLRES